MGDSARSRSSASTCFSLCSTRDSAARRRRPFSRSSDGKAATRSRSFIEGWLMRTAILPRRSAAIVRELEGNPEILAAQERADALQVVLLLSGHADLLSLDGRLHLELGVLDRLDDLLRLLRGDAVEDGDLLPHGRLRGGLHLAVVERL